MNIMQSILSFFAVIHSNSSLPRTCSSFESEYSGVSDEELVTQFISQSLNIIILFRTPGVELKNRSTYDRLFSLQSLHLEAERRGVKARDELPVRHLHSSLITDKLHDAQNLLRRGSHSMYTGTVEGLKETELVRFTQEVREFALKVGFLIP